ncbi:MAG TPA: glycoside hydrolase family 38 C-terminal domain-containing protein, partial [Gemmatimonadales bacterium]
PGAGRAVRGGRPLSQTVAAQGPLVGAIETRWTMRSAGEGEIGVRQLAVLHADSPIIRIRLDLDHHATGHRLRARFPVGAGEAATAGTALGTVRRGERPPIDRESPVERPTATDPAHRFVRSGHGPRGLAILAPGFFEYEWSGDRSLTVTLLRAVGSLSRNDLVERPGHAAWPEATPEAEEPGRHTIWLGIAPLQKSSEEDSAILERIWEEFALPIQSMFLDGGPVDV